MRGLQVCNRQYTKIFVMTENLKKKIVHVSRQVNTYSKFSRKTQKLKTLHSAKGQLDSE